MIAAKDFYLLRTPLLPLNILDQFTALSHAELNGRLKIIFDHPYLQEAIYTASPELYQEFKKWQQCELAAEKVDKLVLSLFKYLLRMCARCTPYGLFAGCAVGEIATNSQIQLAHPDHHKKHCRLDMNYVAELAAMISALPEVQTQLLYYPNNSLYAIGNKYRYAAYKIEHKFRTYHLTEINCSDYLQKIIAIAASGATMATLTESIVSNDINKEEASAFINELVDSQILLSELEPTITGEEFFLKLVNKVKLLAGNTSINEKLARIQHLLQNQCTGIEQYLETGSLVKALVPATNNKDLIQTDLFLATQQNTISATVIADIEKQLKKLWPLARLHENADLKNFCDRFKARYEEQEVPLLIALDAEAGVGYAGNTGSNADYAPLVDDILPGKEAATKAIRLGKIDDLLQKKFRASLLDGSMEVQITDEDLNQLKGTGKFAIPDSFYLMGSLLGTDCAQIDAGNYQFELNACAGPSAANLLARFCHGDTLLTAKVKECLREEEQNNPNDIYAEVVHLPEARTGNVLQRPQLRNYEIVYLGNGSVDTGHQIPLTDLMVSVRNDYIILRSKKLNKRIIPRLTTAHNFSAGSLPAYKFLGDLQFQELNVGIALQWGLLTDELFLPRVRYGKIILSKCTWTLHKKDYAELMLKKEIMPSNYVALMERIRRQLRLPQYVLITEGDNELLIDLDSESGVYVLLTTLIKKEKIVLQEFLKTKDKCFVQGDRGEYTNEIIIPFKRTVKVTQADFNNDEFINPVQIKEPIVVNAWKPRQQCFPQRNFNTGSEWLYVKIYCGTSSAERILTGLIKPMTDQLLALGKIDKWFFIRYADPDNHIRIRFHHASDKGFWKEVLERIYLVMNKDNTGISAYRIQTDTYEREIERYGINTICLSEDVFYYDSEAVLNCMDLLEGEEGERFRWLLAARGIDMLLEDFEYGLVSKAALLKKLQQGFFSQFGGDKILNNQLNDKYRENMQSINSFLNPHDDTKNDIDEAIALFTIRSGNIKKIAPQIKAFQKHDPATPGCDSLLASYIHLFLNRILLSNPRKHELVIYHFLNKYYDSQVAIKKRQLQKI